MHVLRKLAIVMTAMLPIAGLGLPAAARADSSCPTLPSARSFAWALDPNLYIRMPHGDFEDGGDTWTMGGGANVASGVNETVMPASPTDFHALDAPSGSSAQSAPVCVSGNATVMRFFARSEGLAGIAVVEVTARDDSGATQTLLSPALPLTSAWSAPLLLFRLPILGNGFTSVTVTIHSIGLGGINVDDIYIDPLRQR